MSLHPTPRTIWIFHHYADPPDGHWTGTFDLWRHLAARGHRVTIFSSSFSHYSRREERLADGQDVGEATYAGVRFVFVRTAPYERNDARRLQNMVDFTRRAYRAAMDEDETPDVVIGSSPHPLCALAGLRVAKRRGARFFFEVHDLWPLFPVEVGLFGPRHPVALGLGWMERKLAREADLVLPLWPRMDEYFSALGVPAEKIRWSPLGISPDLVNDPPAAAPPLRDRPFVAMYRGRFGLTNQTRTIIEAARILNERGRKDIELHLVGEGEGRAEMEGLASEYDLSNIRFGEFLAREDIRADVVRADVFIGSLPNLPHFARFGMISTKLIDYMSWRRPTILACADPRSLVALVDAGVVVPPGDPVALADAIADMAELGESERARMGTNGSDHVREHHDLRKLAARIEREL